MSKKNLLSLLVPVVVAFAFQFAAASTIHVQTTPLGATQIPGLVGSTVIDFEGRRPTH